MRLRDVFDVFSRRQRQSPKPVAPLTPEFRSRVVMRCIEFFGVAEPGRGPKHFWDEIHERLRYLVGRTQLTTGRHVPTIMDDVGTFLSQCDDERFLDFIECIFRTEQFRLSGRAPDQMINDISDLFLVDDLPYAVTPFVWETRRQFFYGQEQDVNVIASYPKVIRRDDQVTHVWAIEPALTLLRDKQFTSANKEFLEALDDYRKGDYDDCLAKCCSAFESTLKIICDRRKWDYSQKDTAGPLIGKVIKNAGMNTLFDKPLYIIADLRNQLSSSHGSGTQQRNVPQHVAKYAINATAAAMLLLVEGCL